MINIHEVIYDLNSSITHIRGDVAYDKDENEVSYDMAAAQAKLLELEAAESAKEQAQATAKASALAKLAALGLTQDEINALIGA